MTLPSKPVAERRATEQAPGQPDSAQARRPAAGVLVQDPRAYNKLAQLTPEELARGVVTASAGNHAQGLALAAREMGIKATIVMPKTTPEIKVEGVRSRGGKVVLHGDSFPEALAIR